MLDFECVFEKSFLNQFFFQIVTIAVVSVTICFTRKAPAPRQDDVVYEMARTQEKSPYPARGGPYANLYQS